MAKLTATEVARHFSAVLNRVAGGEEVEVVRNGATVAVLSAPRREFLSADEFRDLIASLPPVDEDFADDVRRAMSEVGPPEDPWAS